MANKYKRLRRQYSTNGVNWTDLQPLTYRVGDLIEENSYCSARIYQDFVADPLEVFDCEDGNKYYVHIYQYSDNDGATWVTYKQERDALYETLSEDCGVAYRWEKVIPIDEGYMCENSNKYYKIQKEYSVNGVDWISLNEYQKGDLYESNSEDCGYVNTGGTENPDTGNTQNDVLAFEFTGDSAKYEIYPNIYTATESPFYITLSELGVDIWTNAHRLFCANMTNNPITRIISIPDTSNVTDMSQMFLNCSGLTSLDLSNLNTSNVTDMDNMFYRCSGLTSLDLSSFNTSKVSDMSGMFYNCNGLTSIDLSSFNTSNVTGMHGMFWGCSSLTSMTQVSGFENFNTSNVTDMSSMFKSCSGLTSLDLSSFNTSKVSDMSGMFYNCGGLTSIDLSSFNTSNVSNISNMFTGCSNLRTIYMRNCNTTTISKIETALTDAGIRDNVTIITN